MGVQYNALQSVLSIYSTCLNTIVISRSIYLRILAPAKILKRHPSYFERLGGLPIQKLTKMSFPTFCRFSEISPWAMTLAVEGAYGRSSFSLTHGKMTHSDTFLNRKCISFNLHVSKLSVRI